MTKKQVGLFGLYFQIIGHHWRNSGQEPKQSWNLEIGDDAAVMEEPCLLVCFSSSPNSFTKWDPSTQRDGSRGGILIQTKAGKSCDFLRSVGTDDLTGS